MSKDNKGMIMTFPDKEGKIQHCEMLYADQHMTLGRTHKAFVRLLDANLSPVMEQGNRVNKIVLFEKLTRIGFID